MAGRAANRAHTLFRNLRWMDTHHFNTIFRIAAFLGLTPISETCRPLAKFCAFNKRA
jgi:cephalosporin-C deacetylase-like acetyl esterase